MKLTPEWFQNTSDVNGFPWASKMVAFIHVSTTGQIRFAKSVAQKRILLKALQAGDVLLAGWLGQYSQDVFVVNDWEQAKAALG